MYDREEIQTAISNHTALKLAAAKDEERYQAMLNRRQQLGGMLELARRLNDHRLVRFLEAHKDDLTRLIEAL
jgi:hypothetical protein